MTLVELIEDFVEAAAKWRRSRHRPTPIPLWMKRKALGLCVACGARDATSGTRCWRCA